MYGFWPPDVFTYILVKIIVLALVILMWWMLRAPTVV
ncbi:hypothetical protein C1752_07847 [Acaryochloris thomasi RCC1774]|uniref:Uncharacterized protein n=1 Tax=Acaryochloris thomasi RCC1774 TaxID=1764569 RepID=A0A2W1JAD9_9CYAN|nr:hypothetical protein C1752_07847 [Acaryochloris thomasi RCC1774]